MNENFSLKKERCGYEGCKKKLGVIGGLLCKCEKKFCSKHFHAETHNCEFNYKDKKNLNINLVDARFSKIDKI
jgi:hypothetical protein